jgi:molybdate transport system regulatory protein
VRLSARNQLNGTVASVDIGSVMTIVKVDIGGGQQITSSITKDAADDLGLSAGDRVTVVIKSTEVMLAAE